MYFYYKLIFFAISLANIECGYYLVGKENQKASNNQMNKTEGFRMNTNYDVTDKSNKKIGRKDNDYNDDPSHEDSDTSEHSSHECDPKIFNCERTTEPATDPQCKRPYTTLYEPWRKIDYFTPWPRYNRHDNSMITGWRTFRFGDLPGHIPLTPPPTNKIDYGRTCGTRGSSWTPNSLPKLGKPPKDISIYWAYYKRAIYQGYVTRAKAVACEKDGETFYLYRLPKTPYNYTAYCATTKFDAPLG